jgi:hypothetical protein
MFILWLFFGILVAGAGYFVGHYVIGNDFSSLLFLLIASLNPSGDVTIVLAFEDFLRPLIGSLCAILAVNFYILTYIIWHKNAFL